MVLERTEIVIDPAWCREGAVIPPEVELSEAWYEAFSEANPGYKVELLRDGKVTRRMNAFSSSFANLTLASAVKVWSQAMGGAALDSSIEVRPAPRVIRRPDAAWVSPEHIPPRARRDEPLRVAPDFVAEVVSPSQRGRLEQLEEKMQEWLEWGVRLAWLLDPHTRRVRIYRTDGSVEDLDDPAELSGEEVMPGLTVRMSEVRDD